MSNLLIKPGEIDLKVNSQLDKVVIYPDRAQITRVQTVKLKKGDNSVSFNNLGQSIEEQTIRTTLNLGDATILSTSLNRNQLYFFKDKENEKLYQTVQKLLKELIVQLDKKTLCALNHQMLSDLQDYIQSTLNHILLDQETSLVNLKEALTFINGQLQTHSMEMVSVNQEMIKLTEQLTLAQKELNQVRQLDHKNQNNIEVALTVAKASNVTVSIQYIVTGVSWVPQYDAALHKNQKSCRLSYYARIRQTSGENWDGCVLSFSTAEVDQSLDIPQIYPVTFSGFKQKRNKELTVQRKDVRDLDDGLILSSEDEAPMEPAPEGGRSEESQTVQQTGIQYHFDVPGLQNLPSDGKWHRVKITDLEFKPEIYYETIPEFMEYVYMKGSFVNKTTYPLLPGSVSVFRNRSYMGRTKLEYVAPDEAFALSFGIDEDLQIRRKNYKNIHQPAKGLNLKNYRAWEWHYILSNFKDKPQKVTLKEVIYVSDLKEVKVKVEDPTSPDHVLNDDGIVSWDVKLPADSFKRTKIKLKYSLTAQKSFDLDDF